MNRIQNYFFQPARFGHYVLAFGFMVLVTGVTVSYQNQDFLKASASAFSLAQNGNSLVLSIDGTGEDAGLLGAEINITYDPTLIEISVSLSCPFDSCLDLSERGILKFFAASALPAQGGKTVANKQTFSTIGLNFLSQNPVQFAFTQCDVITSQEIVEDRTCIGISATPSSGGDEDEGESKSEKKADEGKKVVIPIAAVCGNNIKEGAEQCDDGNATNGDGCSSACLTEVPVADEGEKKAAEGKEAVIPIAAVCGNSIREGGEQCDDGNAVNGDGCSTQCTTESPKKTLTSIAVSLCGSCSSPVPVGETTYLNAWAYFSDAPHQAINITSQATYSNGNPAVASLAGSNVVGLSAGQTTITAAYTFEGVQKTNELAVTVSAPVLPPPVIAPTPPVTPPATPPSEGEGEPATLLEGDEGESEVSQTGSSTQIQEESFEPELGPKPETQPESISGTRSSAPALPPVAVIEKQAAARAEQIIKTQAPVKHEAAIINRPKKQEVLSQLAICGRQYPKLDFAGAADADGDGLSNKTECYAGTNATQYDSDMDGCSDGAEINELGTNPKNTDDCGKTAPEETKVTITDPHAGWILRHLETSGIAPSGTAFVTGVVFPAESNAVSELIKSLSDLTAQTDPIAAKVAVDSLMQNAIPNVETFLAEYGTNYDYNSLYNTVEQIKTGAAALDLTEQSASIPESLASALGQLRLLNKDKITIGTANNLPDTELSGKNAKKFTLTANDNALEYNKVYDLVAIAVLNNGKTLSSSPIRFGLDDAVRVQTPRPRSIGNKVLSKEVSLLHDIWIGNVRADSLQDGVEVQIDQLQPTVTGDTEFGSQVFAVWNSIVLASSVISDSEEGAFEIQAPRELEADVGHRVTLYAVKAAEGDNQARSESVNVFFRIKPVPAGLIPALWAGGILLGLLLLLLIARRRAKKSRTVVTPQTAEALYAPQDGTIATGETPKVFEQQMPQVPAPLPSAPESNPESNAGSCPYTPVLADIEKEFDEAFKAAETHQTDEDQINVKKLTPQEESEYEHLEDKVLESQTEQEKMHT